MPKVVLPALDADAPDFSLPAFTPAGERTISLRGLRDRWVVLFFYPADFSFVCPTEVKGFAAHYEDFRSAGAEVLGASPDDVASHRDWAAELDGIPYPLLADRGNLVAQAYGAASSADAQPDRATFIVNPEGKLAFAMKVAANVGRGVAETLRVLQALQTGRLCPADWQPGEANYDVPASGSLA